MKLVDVNVLLYAVDEDAHHHETSRAWLQAALSGGEAVGFPWVVVLAFLRLTTNPALSARPLLAEQAGEVVEGWLAAGPAVVVEPGRRHLELLRTLLREAGTAGNLVNDAHLAALALEHDAEIVSFDTDFARFAGVRWRPPPTEALGR